MKHQIVIREGNLRDAVAVSRQITEFEDPYPEEEYSRRLDGVTHSILVAYAGDTPVGAQVPPVGGQVQPGGESAGGQIGQIQAGSGPSTSRIKGGRAPPVSGRGRPVGFKVGYDRYRDGSFYSWMGGVLPEFRRAGIAAQLARRQEDWAREQGFRLIRLKTRQKHQAMLEFARRRGFVVTDRILKDPPGETRIILEKALIQRSVQGSNHPYCGDFPDNEGSQ